MNIVRQNMKEMIRLWQEDTDGYHGIIYSRLYPDSIPQSYSIRWDNEGKLYWELFEHKKEFKRTHDTIDFDVSKTLENFKKDQSIICLPITEYEFYCFSDCCGGRLPAFFIKLMADGRKSHDPYIDILCEDIDLVMAWISSYFVKKDREGDTSEFGIASISDGELHTAWYDMKTRYKTDIKKNYNDDLPYDRICQIIEDESQADLILFYGEPGTGKSSLIKHLILEYPDTQFIFLDACVLASVQPAKFVNFLTENENTVLILEDCEKILASRENADNSIMSTILNITDGVISDILGIKLICTFNTSLSKIDKAILRKGRLSLKYEFKKLSAEKAKALGYNNEGTLADIFNEEENDFSKQNTRKIGF